jgi:hypothetical protein
VKILWDRDRAGEMKSPSLDRINSMQGYHFSNCQFLEISENVKKLHKQKTHCKRGHAFIGNNFTTLFQGGVTTRICQVCRRISGRRYIEKRNPLAQSRKRKAIDSAIKSEAKK